MSNEARSLHPRSCEAGIGPRVSPTGDTRPVMESHAACADEVEAYAVNPVQAEGSMRVPATAGYVRLAPGPLPGAGLAGWTTSLSYEAESGGV